MLSFSFLSCLIELESAFIFDISYMVLLNIYIENHDSETYNMFISQLCSANELIDYSYCEKNNWEVEVEWLKFE